MPKISQAFETKTIVLPSYPESNVVVRTNVSVNDLIEAEKTDSDIEKAATLVSKFIVSWNFEGDDGSIIPIDKENIKQLPFADMEFLSDFIAPFLKKKVASEKTS